jgi:hypothetical protein
MIRFLTAFLFSFIALLARAQAPEIAPATPLPAPNPSAKSSGNIRLSKEIPDRYKGRIVTVGSGGGVAGRETTYTLLDDGRLFSRRTPDKAYTFVGTQTTANTKRVFWSVEDRCAIKKTKYSKPGNLYRFVGWRKGNETYRVTWAPGDKAISENFEKVYNGFIGMLPKK